MPRFVLVTKPQLFVCEGGRRCRSRSRGDCVGQNSVLVCR
jgi:hypothetical protein